MLRTQIKSKFPIGLGYESFLSYLSWKDSREVRVETQVEKYIDFGDGVILQTPVYHTFHHVINNNNRVIIENKLIKFNDVEYIKEIIK